MTKCGVCGHEFTAKDGNLWPEATEDSHSENTANEGPQPDPQEKARNQAVKKANAEAVIAVREQLQIKLGEECPVQTITVLYDRRDGVVLFTSDGSKREALHAVNELVRRAAVEALREAADLAEKGGAINPAWVLFSS